LLLPFVPVQSHSMTVPQPERSFSVRVYLNPNTGRFWTRDSYEGSSQDPLSLHKYLYCHDNPVMLADPSGHDGDLISTSVSTGIILGLSSWLLSPITANAPCNAEDAGNPAYSRNDADMIVNIIGGHIAGKVIGAGVGALKIGYSKLVGYEAKRIGAIATIKPTTALESSIADSFEGGVYTETRAQTDMIVYRAEGGSSGKFGRFFGTEKPDDPPSAR
jgi:hypothetical protein